MYIFRKLLYNILMNNNIFFNSNKKFNPDIDSKLKQKEKSREIKYKLKNKVDKPILTGEIKQDTPIDLKNKIFSKQQERNKLDAELAQKKRNHRNFLISSNINTKNIERTKPESSIKKSDKILADLKALGIIK